MSEQAIAIRYAKPLLELAEEQGVLDKVNDDMQLFKSTVGENSELFFILRNPIVKGYKKLKILRELFGSRVQALTLSIFEIMSRKNRDSVLYDVSKEFIRLYNEKMGIEHVKVQTAIALPEDLKQELKNKLAAQLNKTIILQEVVKPDLLGGFIIHVGNSQIDNTIKNSLQRLKLNFIQKVYN